MVMRMNDFSSGVLGKRASVWVIALTFLASSSVYAAPASVWGESVSLEAKKLYIQAAAVIEPLLSQTETKEFASLRYAWLNYLMGHYNDAIRSYQVALDMNPGSIDARLGISLPLMAQLRWREATKVLTDVLAISPWDYTAHTRLMECESNLMQWDQLARHAGELSQRYPSDATILVYQARAEAWQGNKANAKAAYKKVLMRFPGHLEATQYVNGN